MQRLAKFCVALCILGSCDDSGKQDPKVIAVEHNAAKFNNTGQEKDTKFLVDAASFFTEQIELAKLAQENSTDTTIRVTGKAIEEDYRQLYSMLKDLCGKKNISIPAEPQKKDKKENKILSYEIADDFDKRFLERTIRDHREAITAQEKQQPSGDNEINQFREMSLARIRKNLDFILFRHYGRTGH
ncbi:MAG: DUF4142 domain-containing protein [Bacteroidia bacterium]